MAEKYDIKGVEKTLERSSEEIRQDIFEKLESLSKTVDQLGNRINETFDWREQVARHPYIAFGAAAGLGFLLSGLFKPSPSPGERIMDTISETVEGIGNTLNSSLKDGTGNKTVSSGLIMTASTIALKAGLDFFLDRMTKDKSAHDMPTNGRQAPKAAPQPKANHVF